VSTLDEWADAACRELGLDPASLDVKVVLDLARDVAHGVARPAAPLTAYLLGVAVGQGRPLAGSAARISQLAAQWAPAGSAFRDGAVRDGATRDGATRDGAAGDSAAGDRPAPRD
jgi:hypothetical protein